MNCKRNIRDGFNEKAKQSTNTKRESTTYSLYYAARRVIIHDLSIKLYNIFDEILLLQQMSRKRLIAIYRKFKISQIYLIK